MHILFVCTHNRCRSILAEAVARHLSLASTQVLQACSAGSHPQGKVYPLALDYLAKHGIATDDLNSQSWHDFTDVEFDIVITVCDSAAGESCPLYLGQALKVHWPLPDPSKLTGALQNHAFDAVIDTLLSRIGAANAALQHPMSVSQFQQQLNTIALNIPAPVFNQ